MKPKLNISSNQLPLCCKSVSNHSDTTEHREKYDRKIREEIAVVKLFDFCWFYKTMWTCQHIAIPLQWFCANEDPEI